MRMSVRVEGWKRLQRLKLACQAHLGPVCVACKFGRTAPPPRMNVAGGPHGPRFAGVNRGASRDVYE
eukprot:249065-Prymnesium_polylepis.1